jgi:hypothetical protein
MVTKGKKPDFSGIDKVEAIPIEQAQLYLSQLATDLAEDGNTSNLYFVSDGETGTSHNLVAEIELQIRMTGSFASTRLDKVIDACIKAENIFRIWWANSPLAHLEVEQCDTSDLLKKTIIEQTLNLTWDVISVAYIPRK